MSTSSGTLICMRNASSYWAMRVVISGLCTSASCSAVEVVDRGDDILLAARDRRRAGCRRSAPGRRSNGTARPGSGSARSRCATAARRSAAATARAGAAHQHDEAGQVGALAAQAVVDPRAHAGPAGDARARVHERVGRVVIDLLGLHRADDADVVGDAGDVRQQLADALARLAVAGELDLRPKQRSSLPCSWAMGWPGGVRLGHRLAVHGGELGLFVEQFRTATARRPCRGRSRAWPWARNGADCTAPLDVLNGPLPRRRDSSRLEQPGQCDRAQTERRPAEERAASELFRCVKMCDSWQKTR